MARSDTRSERPSRFYGYATRIRQRWLCSAAAISDVLARRRGCAPCSLDGARRMGNLTRARAQRAKAEGEAAWALLRKAEEESEEGWRQALANRAAGPERRSPRAAVPASEGKNLATPSSYDFSSTSPSSEIEGVSSSYGRGSESSSVEFGSTPSPPANRLLLANITLRGSCPPLRHHASSTTSPSWSARLLLTWRSSRSVL